MTKLLSLLWLADRIVNFQNSFVRRIFSKHKISIRHWLAVHMTSRHLCTSKSYQRYVSTAITVTTYNSPLCLGSNNFKSIFDSVITVIAVTPYPFTCSSMTGRQFAILFGFCIYIFLVEVIFYWLVFSYWLIQTMWYIAVKIISSRKYTAEAIKIN